MGPSLQLTLMPITLHTVYRMEKASQREKLRDGERGGLGQWDTVGDNEAETWLQESRQAHLLFLYL